MKQRWLIFLLGVLGIGCADSEEMYGCPPPPDPEIKGFAIGGTVRSERNVPIPNIRVRKADGTAETLTDPEGRYLLTGPAIESENRLVAEDIDGEENGGLFRSETFEVEFLFEDRQADGTYRTERDVVLELEKSGKR